MLLWALAAWTAFVWGNRIVNILSDGGGALAGAVAAGMVVLAVAVAVHAGTGRLPRSVPALAAATIVVWAVRVPLLLTHDHGAAFVIVHLGLAAVSIALAGLAVDRSRRPVTTPGAEEGRRPAPASGSAPRPRP